MNKTKKILCGVLASVIAVSVFAGCGKKENTIVVGSKNYNEALILGNMFASIIENNTNLNVERKLNLGGTSVVTEAMKSGEIDLYPEYTGTAYGNIMKKADTKDPDEVYEEVKEYYDEKFDITWLEPLGYNNTYAMAVRKETADEYNLKTVSDLAKVSNELSLGCSFEFVDRADGYAGLKEEYEGMEFNDVKSLDGGLRYQSVASEKTDVVDAWTTEGMLKKFELIVLDDDKGFFPPYYVAPTVRNTTIEKYPEVGEQLDKLGGLINEEAMIDLNYQVDVEGADPKQVADDFLREKGLID